VTSGTTPDVAAADSAPSTVEEYQAAILSAITPLAPVSLELAAAEGCVLAEDVTAAVALPSFDNSSMDGYAVHAADVAGAAEDSPATFLVTGEIAAGDIGTYRLAPGTAMRIMTGARLPAGADAVVPVEWTDDGDAQVAIYRPAEHGNAVRYVGGDAAEGGHRPPAAPGRGAVHRGRADRAGHAIGARPDLGFQQLHDRGGGP
jgi:molybdopterin molybdotransferase